MEALAGRPILGRALLLLASLLLVFCALEFLLVPQERVGARSDEIGTRLEAYAEEYGLAYLDMRPVFLEASRREILHGPEDWRHLSEGGYRLLAGTLAEHLSSRARDAPSG